MIVPYLQLATSDINKLNTPQVKILVGYLILVAGQLKFCLNNFKHLALQYVLHINKVGYLKLLVKSWFFKNGRTVHLNDPE